MVFNVCINMWGEFYCVFFYTTKLYFFIEIGFLIIYNHKVVLLFEFFFFEFVCGKIWSRPAVQNNKLGRCMTRQT